MRDIKFRGKRIDGCNNWVYGSLITNGDRCFIICKDNLKIKDGCIGDTSVQEVDPKTVGQFTGLSDKSKVEIYGDDIIKWKEFLRSGGFGNYNYSQVFFNQKTAQWQWKYAGAEESVDEPLYKLIEYRECDAEVIGNTYEKLNLIK